MEDCRLVELPRVVDPRGNLTVIEGEQDIPFAIQRVYYTYDVPEGEVRGGHAHRDLEQLVISVAGSFDVVLNDGVRSRIVTLNRRYCGLYLPNMLWRDLTNFSSAAVCLVLASAHYDDDDYFRNFQTFKDEVQRRAHPVS